MGRLIDADAFIQDITDEITNLRMNGLKGTPRPTSELYQIIDRVDEQPTAYDVEKVVAELEKNQEGLETDMWAKESNNWYGQYCNGMSEGYENAIDIVKAGGVK